MTDAAASPSTGWADLLGPGTRGAVTVISAGIGLHAFNEFSVAASLPAALEDLGRVELLPLVYAGYFIAVIAGGLLATTVRRAMGTRGAALASAGLFLAGVALCALAPAAAVFVAGRTLQGLSDGMVMSLCYGLIPELFVAALVPRIFAVEALVYAVASIFGPLSGGLAAEAAGWRAAMVVNLPLALVFLVAIPAGIRAEARGRGPRAPWPILALCLVGAAAFAIPSALPGQGWAAWALPAGAALFLAAVTLDGKGGLFPPGAYRTGTLGRGLWMLLTMTMANGISTVFLALSLRSLWGLSPVWTGLIVVVLAMSWSAVALPIGSVEAPRTRTLMIRVGPLVQMTGLLSIGTGMALHVLPLVVLGQMLIGTAFALVWAAANQAIVAAAAPEDRSRTSALIPPSQMTGYAIGAGLGGWAGSVLGVVGALETGGGMVLLAVWGLAAVIAGIGALAGQGVSVSDG